MQSSGQSLANADNTRKLNDLVLSNLQRSRHSQCLNSGLLFDFWTQGLRGSISGVRYCSTRNQVDENVRILGRLHHAFSEIVFVEALIGQQIDISRAKSGALVCI